MTGIRMAELLLLIKVSRQLDRMNDERNSAS